MMDELGDGYQQVLALSSPPIELLAGPADSPAPARVANEAMRETAFQQHPDFEIITSFPGTAAQAGARLLGEIGDDRTRFAKPRSLKAFAGAPPVTRASGRSLVVSQRRIENDRPAAVGFTWGLSALNQSPGARDHYDRRRSAGDGHAAAFRHLFSRFLGCLHHCPQTRQHYREAAAFPTLTEAAAA